MSSTRAFSMDKNSLSPSKDWHAARRLEKHIQNWLNSKQWGFCESAVVPNKAIHAYGQLGHWEQAVGVLREMEYMNLRPDPVNFNTAISACARRKQWKCAVELLDEIKQRSIEPNVISYSAAISACEKGLQCEKALQLLSEMETQGLRPNVISYSAAISACEKGLRWE